MNATFFGDMLQTIADRGRALLERTLPGRVDGVTRSQNLIDECEQLLTGRGEASGVALAREILTQYAALTTGPRIAFFEALANRFGPDHERLEGCDRRLAKRAERRDDGRSASRRRAAPAGIIPPAQSRAQRHRRTRANARAIDRCHGSSRRSCRGRCRFRASVFVMVQSRLPRAAPHRLVDARQYSGKDHPARGRAQDPKLGRSAPPHRSGRPLLLCVLSSGTGRRAADFRRGRAGARDRQCHRADPCR